MWSLLLVGSKLAFGGPGSLWCLSGSLLFGSTGSGFFGSFSSVFLQGRSGLEPSFIAL